MPRILPLLVSLTACTPLAEGRWTGGCAAEEPLRVVLELSASGEDFDATGSLHVADQPGDFVSLSCRASQSGREVLLGGCFGTWSSAGTPSDAFSVTADIRRGEASDELLGTCTFGLDSAELELWRTP